MKNIILKYKIYIIISIIGILVLLVMQFSGKNNTNSSPSPSPLDLQTEKPSATFSLPPYSKPLENLAGEVDLNSEQITTAIESKNKIKNSLPIYIKNFRTSNGLKTTLNVYTISSDPEYLVHIEIYGIDFNNPNISKETNPNVIAFIDSFEEIKKRLATKGVDIHNIYFIFGQRQFIQETADLWIKTYGLL